MTEDARKDRQATRDAMRRARETFRWFEARGETPIGPIRFSNARTGQLVAAVTIGERGRVALLPINTAGAPNPQGRHRTRSNSPAGI